MQFFTIETQFKIFDQGLTIFTVFPIWLEVKTVKIMTKGKLENSVVIK